MWYPWISEISKMNSSGVPYVLIIWSKRRPVLYHFDREAAAASKSSE